MNYHENPLISMAYKIPETLNEGEGEFFPWVVPLER